MLHVIQDVTPRTVVNVMFDIIRFRVLGQQKVKKPIVRVTDMPPSVVIYCMERYCATWIDHDSLRDVLPVCIAFCNTAIAQTQNVKQIFLPLLRYAFVMCSPLIRERILSCNGSTDAFFLLLVSG